MSRTLPLVASLAAAIAACGGGDQLVSYAKEDAADAALDALDAAPPVEVATDLGKEADALPADVAPACPGGVGCACKGDGECSGGACLPTELGMRCAGPCDAAGKCAVGYGCKATPSGAQVCVARLARLCEPCLASIACKTLTEPNSHCVAVAGDKGQSGFYCAPACEDATDCPPGYSCLGASAIEDGAVAKRCLPNSGECGCTPLAIADDAVTTCFQTAAGPAGTFLGPCKGKRACTKAGLGACTAPKPAVETCNGKDDDCDGQTDEGPLCNDGSACTTDKCLGGMGCDHVPTTLQCNDGNACTADGCDPKTGCTHAHTTAPCDDGSMCTSGDACAGGACQGQPVSCDDANPCTDQTCKPATGCLVVDNADPCSDFDACTTGDVCTKGACKGAGKKSCDDGNSCTADACLPASGCTATAADGLACNDGDACTLSDACTASACVGKAASCDDANPCTVDSCAAKSGCAHLPAPATPCDDGNACTAADACAGGACKGGALVACSDGTTCTKDLCDGATGCVFPPVVDGLPCSDGSVCTQGDVCKDGACAGKPITCDDGNPCTTDFCDKAKGCDSTLADGTPCAIPCWQDSVCQGGVCKGKAKAADGAPCPGAKSCTDGVCGP